MEAGMEVCLNPIPGVLTNTVDLAIATVRCLACHQWKPVLSSRCNIVPQGNQQATWLLIDYIGHLTPWRSQ